LRPHFAEAHFNLGTLLVDLRRYSEARAPEVVARRRPGRSTQYWLGNASMGLGDSRAACAAYEAAVQLDAGHAKARWGLVMAQVPPVIDADTAPGATVAAFTRELGKAGAWLDAQKPRDAHAIVGARSRSTSRMSKLHRDALSEHDDSAPA
jgi:hypothetical protein